MHDINLIQIILVTLVAFVAGMASVLDERPFHRPLVACTLTGIALGLLGSFTLGASAIGAVMATRGAPDLQILPDPWLVGVILPGALLATVTGAVALALRRLRTMPLTMTLTTGE